MNIEAIQTFINSTGFPIGMTLLLCWHIKTTQEKNNEALEDLKDAINDLLTYIKRGGEL